METIRTYLENMFMNLPDTEEVRRAKEELLQMMEDKYNELKASGRSENEVVGIVISEFGNLEEVAEELGISSYLNSGTNNGYSSKEKSGHEEEYGEDRVVSVEEAQDYIDATGSFGNKIAIGVALCIWSPIILVVLGGMSDGTGWEEVAGGIGLLALLLLVAPAVALFVFGSMQYQKYEGLKKDHFTLAYSARNYVIAEKEGFRGVFAMCITIGVVLCILSVIPIIVLGMAFSDNKALMAIGVGVLLFLISIGVFLFIFAGIRHDSYAVLLQEEEYRYDYKPSKNDRERAEKVVGVIGSVYWSIVTCIYLGWSFLSWEWGRTWIIWPVTGVLFGAVSSIAYALMGVSKDK